MRKSVVFAAVASAPLLGIAVREAARLIGGMSDPKQAGAAPLLWIFGVFVTLVLIWTGVALIGRASAKDPAKLPFEATAAIAIAEAKKRPPAPKCPVCGRPRVGAGSRCLYCRAVFADPPGIDPQ
ncbi:MAG TPA: hypothetical protein VFL12_01320 [Thermoanaerobaculia bacterium]|nr:hypothetical protein [Thermoanaerobaculia bacterium]